MKARFFFLFERWKRTAIAVVGLDLRADTMNNVRRGETVDHQRRRSSTNPSLNRAQQEHKGFAATTDRYVPDQLASELTSFVCLDFYWPVFLD